MSRNPTLRMFVRTEMTMISLFENNGGAIGSATVHNVVDLN
jgi:hypothetical protein